MAGKLVLMLVLLACGLPLLGAAVTTTADSQPESRKRSGAAGSSGSFGWLDTDALVGRARLVASEAWDIWSAGGWCMPAIATVAMLMFGLGVHIELKLRATGFRSTPEKVWRRWISHSDERCGPIGELLDFVTGARSLKESRVLFDELQGGELAPFDRDLRVMKVCVGAAPLLGLLGTVTGMLTTFHALSSGAGGEKTMAMIAAGISEALITTETGLVVALPGLFFLHHLSRTHERYRTFLAHLETLCMQELHWKLRAKGQLAECAPVHA